jgi:hypothetical protein
MAHNSSLFFSFHVQRSRGDGEQTRRCLFDLQL